jgi:L-asparagine transporter-like permease
MSQIQESHLKRNLKNRHIQFIALGGTVGTGLFLCTGRAIFTAGPSVILGYAVSGVAIFLIMRQLGEMNTQDPSAGASSYFAYKYWGDFPGFLAGWNYWILQVLVGIAELTAAAVYMQYWFPGLAAWKTALLFFVIINAINLTTVEAYGEAEFWFSSIKVFAICATILTGVYIIFINPSLVAGASIKNLWQPSTVGIHVGDKLFSGFFPHGIIGLIATFPVIAFAFGGLELIGIAASEAKNPTKTIPKAINQAALYVLVFYVVSLGALLSLYHWSNLNASESPFVMIFDKIGFKYAATALNFIVLTAALSVYNGCIYGNSRMLYGLALQKNAPQIFTKTSKRGIPAPAIFLSAILTSLVVPLNYFIPNWADAFKVVMSFVVVCVLINWAMITLSHIKFKQKNHKTLFPAPFYPYTNYITLAFIFFILVAMCFWKSGMAKQVIALPIWILIVYILYRFLQIRKAK